jgi:hypothetical protein
VLDLQGSVVLDYRDPRGTTYLTHHRYATDGEFGLVALPGLTVSVRDLLPPIAEDDSVE